MSHQETRKVVSKAVLDEEFRKELFNDPEKALSGFDLTPEEIQALRSMPAETIDDFANNLEERISMSVLYYSHDLMRSDAAQSNAAGGNAAQYDVMRSDAAQSNAAGGNAAQYDVMRNDAAQSDAAGGNAAQSDALRADVSQGEAMSNNAMSGEVAGGAALGESSSTPISWLARLAAALGIRGTGGGAGPGEYY